MITTNGTEAEVIVTVAVDTGADLSDSALACRTSLAPKSALLRHINIVVNIKLTPELCAVIVIILIKF